MFQQRDEFQVADILDDGRSAAETEPRSTPRLGGGNAESSVVLFLHFQMCFQLVAQVDVCAIVAHPGKTPREPLFHFLSSHV
jgi:hypothetical protein